MKLRLWHLGLTYLLAMELIVLAFTILMGNGSITSEKLAVSGICTLIALPASIWGYVMVDRFDFSEYEGKRDPEKHRSPIGSSSTGKGGMMGKTDALFIVVSVTLIILVPVWAVIALEQPIKETGYSLATYHGLLGLIAFLYLVMFVLAAKLTASEKKKVRKLR